MQRRSSRCAIRRVGTRLAINGETDATWAKRVSAWESMVNFDLQPIAVAACYGVANLLMTLTPVSAMQLAYVDCDGWGECWQLAHLRA